MRIRACVAALAVGLCAGPAAAEQQINWKQVSNRALGTSLPPGLKADILGIELGEPYAAVKQKLEALRAEGGANRPIEEMEMSISLSSISASYVSTAILRREIKGVGPRPASETIEVHFSAPSSGHQVLSITRSISYRERDDQVRIAEVVKALSEKFQSTPQQFFETRYRWQFNDGLLFVAKRTDAFFSCTGAGVKAEEHEIPNINPTGECDVLMDVTFTPGISPEHAGRMSFTLIDYERAKANLTADYGFFANYVNEVRSKTSGAAPKL